MNLEGFGLSNWTAIDPVGKNNIFDLYYFPHEPMIRAAIDFIKGHLFEGGFNYKKDNSDVHKDFEPDEYKELYSLMDTAIDLYFMYGMCPYRKAMSLDINGNGSATTSTTNGASSTNNKVVIVPVAYGNFVTRMNHDGSWEVGFKTLDFFRPLSSTMTNEPDPDVFVHIWPGRQPIFTDIPRFNSTITTLLPLYHRMQRLLSDDTQASHTRARPTLMMETKDNKSNLASETESRVIEDVFGMEGMPSIEYQTERRRDTETFSRFEEHLSNIRRIQQIPEQKIMFDRKLKEKQMPVFQNWESGNLLPLPKGYSVASGPKAEHPTDFMAKQENSERKILMAFGIPISIYTKSSYGSSSSRSQYGKSGGSNSFSTTESKNFRTTITRVRNAASDFIEAIYPELINPRNVSKIARNIMDVKKSEETYYTFIRAYQKKYNIGNPDYLDGINKDRFKEYDTIFNSSENNFPDDLFEKLYIDLSKAVLQNTGIPADPYTIRDLIKTKVVDLNGRLKHLTNKGTTKNNIKIKWKYPAYMGFEDLLFSYERGLIDRETFGLLYESYTGINISNPDIDAADSLDGNLDNGDSEIVNDRDENNNSKPKSINNTQKRKNGDRNKSANTENRSVRGTTKPPVTKKRKKASND